MCTVLAVRGVRAPLVRPTPWLISSKSNDSWRKLNPSLVFRLSGKPHRYVRLQHGPHGSQEKARIPFFPSPMSQASLTQLRSATRARRLKNSRTRRSVRQWACYWADGLAVDHRVQVRKIG